MDIQRRLPNTKTVEEHDFQARLLLARDTFNTLQVHTQTADQKVQFVLTANAFLAASLSFEGGQAIEKIQSQGLNTLASLTLVSGGLILIGIVVSTLFTVLTLVPRITVKHKHSLFYFVDVAAMDSEAYVKEFMNLHAEELYEQMVMEVHASARIVETKFMWARRATLALAGTLFLWVAIRVVQFLW